MKKIFLTLAMLFVFAACKDNPTVSSEKTTYKEECSRPKCYPSIDTNVFHDAVFQQQGRIAYEYVLVGNDSIKIEHVGCNSIIFKYAIHTFTKDTQVNNEHIKHSLNVLKKLSKGDVSGANIEQGADSLLVKLNDDMAKNIGIFAHYDLKKYHCQTILSQAFIENDSVNVWISYLLENK